ncbi:glycosyltransferase family 4 protein [Flavobacterium sp. GT3R68]|uniref:glycosyltransferase family 4 protein n=1 Tax=Flavobacterium sp. GT3R68 TaxID=2594437 RepID=UPI000F892E40|nr:glycosyltransferase family 4 protein [Flavobacterium sp. GT3R68]RTY92296.1 glycosyltransferase family 4 protein [Flavobacterium sp. GSN2]TRW92532.1 glycosyltransferase family 4 protein [Flavobacterium sp. GT3R68]
MKILYVTDQLYQHGGIEKILAQKINHWLTDYNYEVVLCTSEQRNNEFVYPVNAKLKHIDLGINYARNQSYFHPKNLIKSFFHFKALKKHIKSEQPDFIISVNFTPEQYFLPYIEKQIPKIKEFHSSGVTLKKPEGIMEKLKFQLFLLLGRYKAQVVLSADEKKYYPFQHLYVIPNFIELHNVAKSLPGEKTIIAAGRIASVKQFDHLIKAWSQIATDFPDWEVKIFGDGDDKLLTQLKQLILELEVPNIHLAGPSAYLEKEMQKASIYAMTSATECFPMVLLEAQVCGLPIISYDCPNGPRNIITHNQDGWLTSHNEIGIFAQRLAELIKNESKRKDMGIAAKFNVIRFTSEKVMEQWNQLLINIQTK